MPVTRLGKMNRKPTYSLNEVNRQILVQLPNHSKWMHRMNRRGGWRQIRISWIVGDTIYSRGHSFSCNCNLWQSLWCLSPTIPKYLFDGMQPLPPSPSTTIHRTRDPVKHKKAEEKDRRQGSECHLIADVPRIMVKIKILVNMAIDPLQDMCDRTDG